MMASDFRGGPHVVLFCGTSLVSRLIRWQTRGRWSHAAVVLDGQVYEAREGRGVICRRWGTSGYPDTGWTVRVPALPLEPDEVRGMLAFLRRQVGQGYDYRQVLRFVSRRGAHAGHEPRWFCSELVAAAFLVVGRPLFTNTEPWEVAPDWLDRTPLLVTTRTKETNQ